MMDHAIVVTLGTLALAFFVAGLVVGATGVTIGYCWAVLDGHGRLGGRFGRDDGPDDGYGYVPPEPPPSPALAIGGDPLALLDALDGAWLVSPDEEDLYRALAALDPSNDVRS